MSYQVLARKWRPRVFREMVGQEHVLQALINALDHNRLHHAYLFTGTRGVGKTTIARILAKCLNCETGVSSEPCGTCGACREIAEGRFIDLIEVDAASRTKVEDTRDLLENVQYAPSRGRYKVYLIDEVHMLSTSSFNALLKTLEEPPPHVKFLLATTDPQKLPVTVLSRCLQFNLKNMPPERIVGHLAYVLEKELVPFEDAALWQLGRSADGSMRDALSLTDQAIAFGNGKISEVDVRAMLGSIDQQLVYAILDALAAANGQAIFAAVNQLAEHAPDYQGALAELLSVLHRIAIAQALPEAIDNSFGDRDQVIALAAQLPAEDVQLFYQTALHGRRDLPLAPDPRSGFEMVLLRMLAFKPQGVADLPKAALHAPVAGTPAQPAPANIAPVQVQSAPQMAAPAVPVAPLAEVAVATATEPAPAAMQSAATAPVSSSEPVSTEPEAAPHSAAASVVDADTPPWDMDDEASNLYADDVDQPAEVSAAPHMAVAPAVAEPVVPPATVAPSARVATPPVPTAPAAQAPASTAGAVSASEPTINVAAVKSFHLVSLRASDWVGLYLELKVAGVLQSTAANCALMSVDGNVLRFTLDQSNANLFDISHQQRLADVLTAYFDEPVSVVIEPGQVLTETPSATAIRLRAEKQAQALESLQTDPLLKKLEQKFHASLDEATVEPL